jgi:hypothetical protein
MATLSANSLYASRSGAASKRARVRRSRSGNCAIGENSKRRLDDVAFLVEGNRRRFSQSRRGVLPRMATSLASRPPPASGRSHHAPLVERLGRRWPRGLLVPLVAMVPQFARPTSFSAFAMKAWWLSGFTSSRDHCRDVGGQPQ